MSRTLLIHWTISIDIDFSKLLEKPRPLNIERLRSLDERSLTELSGSPQLRNADNASRAHDHADSYVFSPSVGRRSGFNTPRSVHGFESHPMVGEAWDALRRSMVYFRGQPVGTIAAVDNSEEKLNYDQTLRLQSWEKKIDRFQLGEGVMPASFKVFHDPVRNHETLIADLVRARLEE
ncbi:putative alkaline/neutral invertase B [Raphanus sativus]|nr:putative alkaline/neutral invertase B [Raphanus sativus]